ncbi:1-aminocyclopropane-1-carboxylate deaminase/D-cysteine desulfhydrase [Frankia sp. ACN1ag]|uniref:1-aminocyclopropane-1-carboxylate deaminase/D-cysteine desulfhydrase n=1 Tax=Frankia sp. ACN1ag TaxID=102891 RepID=UPI0006DC3CE4|nr:pyridoxal-phosphate dependent enzyme [Frankia sp. ACN1ag]KQC35679.1 1-aminocyclopropane-1-carboxylate deaminase [Frankia sp. ACN1ag]
MGGFPLPALPSPLEEIADARLGARGVRLLLKRDDLIHRDIPGNKWRKLRGNLDEARRLGHDTLLTFGGAYSNHIRAVAAAGRLFGLRTVGVIRGEEHLPLNPTLRFAVDAGMRLAYLDRTSYRAKTSAAVVERLSAEFGAFYLLPEGGSNALGVRGCAALPAEIDRPFDVLCCSCGTGGTLAGLAAGLAPGQRALGVPVLRGAGFLADDVDALQRAAFGANSGNWTMAYDFHFGGYARSTPELGRFIVDFHDRHGLGLEPVYEAKLLYALFALAEADAFAPGTTVVAVLNAVADGLGPDPRTGNAIG